MIIDIIIVSITVFGIMHCFKKGFIKSLFSSVSAALGGIAVIVFYNDFTEFVKSTYLGNIIKTNVAAFICDKYNNTANAATQELKVPFFLKKTVESGIKSLNAAAVDFADSTAQFVSAVIAVIILIIVIKIILSIIPKVLDVVVSIPVIKQCDKILGCVFGIICGVIWAVLFVYACGLISLVPSFDFINSQLDTSFFLKAVYNII